MSIQALLLGLLPALATPTSIGSVEGSSIFALRVGIAHTVSGETIPHAVILVENGEITLVGQDVEIERGIPTIDLPDTVVAPGFVSCNTRIGLETQGTSGAMPQVLASKDLYPRQEVWADLREEGITTLGLAPIGNGIPGQACAVRPAGSTAEDMLLRDSAYLMVYLQSNAGSKKMLRDGFDEVDDYLEKEQSEFEKWEKKNEKAKKKKKKDDDDKDDEKEDEESGAYEPPQPKPDVVPFMRLREGELSALIQIRKASDWLHLLDVIEEEESVDWDLRVQIRDDSDIFHVIDHIGEQERRVVINPDIVFMPGTRRDRNLPAELHQAGAKLTFVPNVDNLAGHKQWRADVSRLIAAGLDKDAALRAMTLEAACVLGVDDQVGSIEAGKAANLVFYDGDPFEPNTRIQAVMLQGDVVHGELDQ